MNKFEAQTVVVSGRTIFFLMFLVPHSPVKDPIVASFVPEENKVIIQAKDYQLAEKTTGKYNLSIRDIKHHLLFDNDE